ncbi:MAG TPA: hypothetical protein VD965_09440 [Burkholderiales bacterium]|nr:hypothetical protein [Burkholderiales bacterium]
MNVKIDPSVKELMPSFISNRRRDLEAMRDALQAGDLEAIREVGRNIRCFSRVYGIDELTALGEDIHAAADEGSSLRILHLQRKLADYIERLEIG